MSKTHTLRWLWFALAVAAYVVFLGQLGAPQRFFLVLGLCLAYIFERFTRSTLRAAAFLGLATVLSVASFPFLAAEGISRWSGGGMELSAISPEAMGVGFILGLSVAILFSIRVAKPSSLEPLVRQRVLLTLALLAVAMLLLGDVLGWV